MVPTGVKARADASMTPAERRRTNPFWWTKSARQKLIKDTLASASRARKLSPPPSRYCSLVFKKPLRRAEARVGRANHLAQDAGQLERNAVRMVRGLASVIFGYPCVLGILALRRRPSPSSSCHIPSQLMHFSSPHSKGTASSRSSRRRKRMGTATTQNPRSA